MPLQHDYRPKSLREMYGNTNTSDNLKTLFRRERDKLPKSYLLSGPAGSGKTTLAYIIRDLLHCSKQGFKEFDASTDRGIDNIRRIKQNAELKPLDGDVSVFFFDECHGVTGPAQEAMLKLLENPPEHVFAILATTQPEKMKDTIRRRCHEIHTAALPLPTLETLVNDVVDAENKTVGEDLIKKICAVANGSAGQALKLLDQVIDIDDEKKAFEIVEGITYSDTTVLVICRTLTSDRLTVENKWEKMRVLLSKFEGNAESLRFAILNYTEKLLLGDRWSDLHYRIMLAFSDTVIYTGRAGLTIQCYMAMFPERLSE